ncbi:MAG: glutamine--tRNA ligase/YqeY domain fusion protein [Myxococcota bacterium]
MPGEERPKPTDFIRQIVAADVRAGRHGGRVVTRFPPEPSGCTHIGHAKAICLNFGIASEFPGGRCHLRFDDTNPSRESREFVDEIQRDIRWLGYDWGEHLYHASDYFGRLYEYALELIRRGGAYVCDLSPDEMRTQRGTLTEPGVESPGRRRTVEENLDLFRRMRAGEFDEGSRTLRARIDMASPNLSLRDPVLYRIQKVPHHRTGDEWCIYPIYDFAHCLSDSIEGITHSLCSLEFEDRRALYDWILDALEVECHPQQIEFARLNLSHTTMSKRLLRQLVEGGYVRGWDDPRLPTLAGLRRRGYTPESIRAFCAGVGVARRENLIEMARLEHEIRDDLNRRAPRAMAVLDPLKVVLENWPKDRVDRLPALNNPEDPSAGRREVPLGRELWIERDDFREDPPRKFFRLAPGREVRLRYGYLITCTDVVHDAQGRVSEVRCRYDPETRGGNAPDGRRVKGTIHWVSAADALEAEVRLYGPLFSAPTPGEDLAGSLALDSLETVRARVEPSLAGSRPGSHYQFERLGYFCVDPDSDPDRLVFNRTVTLRDRWARMQKRDARA